MPVNSSAWRSWPVAPRETTFNADDAIARLQNWAGGSAKKFNEGFLFRLPEADPKNPASYRLPLADVIDGKLVLIPRAVFSAGVIMSGGHGGLYDVLSDADRKEIRGVLTQIYDFLAEEYSDPRVVAPWLRGNTQEERDEIREELGASAVRSEWDLPVAPDDTPWDLTAARKRVWDWAEGEYGVYGRAFLYADLRAPNTKDAYRLPVADLIDGELKIVPRAVSTLAALFAGDRARLNIPGADMEQVASVVQALQDRINEVEGCCGMDDEDPEARIAEDQAFGEVYEDDEDDEMTASAVAPVRPPRSWFDEPQMSSAEPLTVTADGRVYGLIAMFNRCHAGIANTCVMAPRNTSGYKYFKNGQVLTADGSMVRVGKLTMGTGHAGPGLRGMPAAAHYDNTGTAIAVVNVGENRHGIWVAGSVVPNATEEQVAELRRSPISGDWRRMGGYLELVAALAVNTPGFPIVASLEGSDEPDVILAAGVLLADGTVAHDAEEELKSEADEAFQKRVDALDKKVSDMLAKRRAGTYDRISAAMDRRK